MYDTDWNLSGRKVFFSFETNKITLMFNNDRRKVDRSNHDVSTKPSVCRFNNVSVCRYKQKLLYHDLCKKNLGVCFANLFCLMSQKSRLFILCSFMCLIIKRCRFKILSGRKPTMCKKAAASLVSWKRYCI